jgi:hypothetical protein
MGLEWRMACRDVGGVSEEHRDQRLAHEGDRDSAMRPGENFQVAGSFSVVPANGPFLIRPVPVQHGLTASALGIVASVRLAVTIARSGQHPSWLLGAHGLFDQLGSVFPGSSGCTLRTLLMPLRVAPASQTQQRPPAEQ